MKISLLVPTRDRINMVLTLISSIIVSVNDINNVELLLGVDEDDPTLEHIVKITQAIPFVKLCIIQNDSKFIGINKIWNVLASKAANDILGYIGDDMVFITKGWDTEIINEHVTAPEDKIKLVHCYDGYRNTDEISVNAFIHKKYVEVLGYMCREEFLINWSDQWMYQTFKAFNRVTYRRDIHIQHNHWVFGLRERDNTANRMLSDNKGKISDGLWHSLAYERIKDVDKLSKYLNLAPDWSKVDK